MLTDYQYEALLRYRDAVIPVPPEGLPPVDMELLEMRLIEPAEFGSSDYGIVKIHATPLSYQITEKGKQALEEYEKAQKAKWEQKRRQFLRDLFIAVSGGIVGAVVGSILTLLIEHIIL